MIINQQTAYFFGDLVLLTIWCLFYYIRKDTRKEMLFCSVLVGLVSPFTAYLWWTVDWWHPLTITGTKIGIEDFLIGFATGGIGAVVYELFFRKKIKFTNKKTSKNIFWLFISSILISIAILFYVLKLTSFWSMFISLLLAELFFILYRRDLIKDSIFSGIFMVITVLPFYYSILFLVPTWVGITYDSSLSGMRLTGIPIEELIFFFLMGLLIGPLYEFKLNARIVNK